MTNFRTTQMTIREDLEKEYGHINPAAELKYNVLLGVFGVHWWGGKESISQIRDFLLDMADACDVELAELEEENEDE